VGCATDSDFIESLLLVASNELVVLAPAFVVIKVEGFAVAAGDEHFLPGGVHGAAGGLQGGSPFFLADFENGAPGACARQFGGSDPG
jgi:hypothetical protein